MAWGEPVTASGYVKWDKPKTLVGKLLSHEQRVGKNDKTYTVYSLDSDGETIQITGTTILDDLLEQIAPGTLVKVEYQGEKVIDKGRLKLFVVQPWVETP